MINFKIETKTTELKLRETLEKLTKQIPEFKIKKDHEIGIHIIMGDLKNLAKKAIQENNIDLIKRIVKFITSRYNEGGETQNAVFVSFFENMDKETSDEVLKYFSDEIATKIKQFYKKL